MASSERAVLRIREQVARATRVIEAQRGPAFAIECPLSGERDVVNPVSAPRPAYAYS